MTSWSAIDLALLALASGVVCALLVFLWLRGRQARQVAMAEQQQQHWAEQGEQLEQQLAEQQGRQQQLQSQNTELQVQLSAAQQQLQQQQRLEQQLAGQSQQLEQLQADKAGLQAEARALQVKLESEQQKHQEKLALLEKSGEQMQQQFRHLAQQIFDENSRQFGSQQQEKMEGLLRPLRDQLGDFRRRVDDVYDKEARDRQGLSEQINQLKQLNLQMSQDAVNLTNALKGENKAQGNWGELVLERVLEESGLRRGYEYEVQVSATDEAGKRLQPDVLIHLPENKAIVVDAKVSLVAYERYCSSEDEGEQQAALREHILSIKRHIKGLSDKGYEGLPGIQSLDFVLLFIPIESAFLTAIEQDRQLFGDAFERNILLVSPSTLLVTLRTINNIWRYEKQNANALEIAKRGGDLYDKFVGFAESLEDVGRHLGQTQRAYDTAMGRLSSGKGNLLNRVTALQKLGVRAKKSLPQSLLERADIEQSAALDDQSAD